MTKEWNPAQLLDLSGSYWQTCALHAAVVLDVFTPLGDDRLTARGLALRMGVDPRALAMLLNALVAMGLMAKYEDRFANVPTGSVYLSRDSDRYLGHMIKHHSHLMESWIHLAEAVRSGEPRRETAAHAEEDWRESFLMGMFNLASQLAPVLVPQIDLSSKRTLLDLGGGPGTYAIHFCRANPQLRAVVYDLPTTRPFAEKTIARFGMQERVSFTDGDFLHDAVMGRYDAAWLSHILHGEGPQECARILESAAAALEPGGVMLIHEFILDDDEAGPLFPALFSLNMLLGTSSGQSYSGAQIGTMLKAAGLEDIRRLPLEIPSPSGVISAVKP